MANLHTSIIGGSSIHRFGAIAFSLIMLAGCATKKHAIDGLEPLANHDEWRTTLSPTDAAETIAKGVMQFGFVGEKSFWGTRPPKPTGDFFDQGLAVANAHGQELHLRALWLKENSTQIILETALPKDRHKFLIKTLKASVAEREQPPGK